MPTGPSSRSGTPASPSAHSFSRRKAYFTTYFVRYCTTFVKCGLLTLLVLSYLISPRTCHRFVGHLEEEAVRTYTHAIEELEKGHLPEWYAIFACPHPRPGKLTKLGSI